MLTTEQALRTLYYRLDAIDDDIISATFQTDILDGEYVFSEWSYDDYQEAMEMGKFFADKYQAERKAYIKSQFAKAYPK